MGGHSTGPEKVRCSHYPGTKGCESLRLTQSFRPSLLKDTVWQGTSEGGNCSPGPCAGTRGAEAAPAFCKGQGPKGGETGMCAGVAGPVCWADL